MAEETTTDVAEIESGAPLPTEDSLTGANEDSLAGETETEAESPPASFDDWDLHVDLRRALSDMGYERPMPVQEAVFTILTEGKDLMVQSKTGSGKTSAFGIPISQLLSSGEKGVQSLILAPTRELGLQVAKELDKLTQHMDVSVVPVYGGAPINPQIAKLKAGAQIVAGTPGRVLDHIRRKTLDTSGIRLFVLDECDEMLSMGFQEEIENIISYLPAREDRQTLLFSATIPKEIERIARKHMREPEMLSLSSDSVGAELIDHYYYVVSGMARTRDLLKLMKAERPSSAIIFCNTREETTSVARYLRRHGYDSEALSSDLSQSDRERVMGRMRAKNLDFLVATDIAARGIDISELSHVINFTFPSSPEVYVHRTGRTGRAGKQGTALSLVGPREIGAFYYLKLIYKIIPTERDLPTADEMTTIEEGEQYEKVVKMLDGQPKSEYLGLARRLWQSNEGERVVALLLQELLTQKPAEKKPSAQAAAAAKPSASSAASPEAEAATEEEPRRKRRRRRGASEEEDSAPARTRGRSRRPATPEDEPDSLDASEGVTGSDSTASEADDSTGSKSSPMDRPETESSEERPRRKRRRRRRSQSEQEETQDQDEGTALEAKDPERAEVEAAPPVSEVASESEVEAQPEEEAPAKEAVEAEAEPTGSDTDASADAAPEEGDKSRRKRRRRRGRSSEEKSGEEDTQPAAEAPSKASKRRTRKPRVDPGSHGEFWEAWAETKTDDAPESAQKEAEESADGDPPAEVPEAEAVSKPKRKRRRRSREKSEEPEELEPGMARLFVNVGKREDADADEIRAFLAEALGEEGDELLGKITLRNSHCYVRVSEDDVDRIIEACTGLVFKERDVVVERAARP